MILTVRSGSRMYVFPGRKGVKRLFRYTAMPERTVRAKILTEKGDQEVEP